MSGDALATRVAVTFLALGTATTAASAADFDWKKFQGKTVTFLANNNPVSQALLTYKDDFEKLTGMTPSAFKSLGSGFRKTIDKVSKK